MQKDIHKVKSYKYVCKVPHNVALYVFFSNTKKTHNARNERKILLLGGIFNTRTHARTGTHTHTHTHTLTTITGIDMEHYPLLVGV